jgi:hypothetical protein
VVKLPRGLCKALYLQRVWGRRRKEGYSRIPVLSPAQALAWGEAGEQGTVIKSLMK